MLVIFPFGNFSSYAHPLDVSNTTFTIYEKNIVGVTYIHPVELDRILVNNTGIEPTAITIESYYTLTGVLTKYLAETIQLTNAWESCVMWSFAFQEWLMVDEIYSWGFPISYTLQCSSLIEDALIKITFLNEVPLQTNRLYVYQTLSGVLQRTAYKVLNNKKDTHTLTLAIGNWVIKDSDEDGLSDEDEILYGTDPIKKDSDEDGYADTIEIQSSWNPLSKELSPWQKVFDATVQSTSVQQPHPDPRQGANLSQDASVWWWERFRVLLRDIRLYIEWSTEWKGLYLLLFSVGVLGFLHAIGPGHSKGILISQIIDDGMSYSRSIIYCLIFTVIHLLDIIIVVAITKLFFHFIDPSIYLSTITQVSTIFVILIWLYLMYFSIKRYRSRVWWQNDLSHQAQNKNHIILAIITGLTPCAFGWSIFLMLLAIGKISLAPPLLLSLWIWIFLCLSMIATITWFMRKKIYTISPRFSLFSPVVSSLCIILIGVSLFIRNF
jgi:ABC-type nickel/cobalt efflux system permease component RcnA